MAVSNSSGRDVEYDVQPSNPGGNLTAPVTASMLLTAGGGAFTAYGCLAEGGTAITVVGLFLLAASLVANAIALNRASSGSAQLGKGPKTLLANGATHAHTFTPGTWVVFYEVGAGSPITQSPVVFDDVNCTVMLRQCPPPAEQSLVQEAKTFVEVVPSGT